MFRLMKLQLLIIICCCVLFTNLVWAGRPFFTDDAGLTNSGDCQLETWVQVNGNNDLDLWAVPACNPSGNFEIALGLDQLHSSNDRPIQQYVLQGKTLFRGLETNNWGLGFAFGITRTAKEATGSEYAYVPLSLSLADGNLIVHANLGWLRNHPENSKQTTWGIGAEYAITQRASVFSEIFGNDIFKPTQHSGLSFSVIPNRLHINLTVGHNKALEKDAYFYSFGINVYSPP